MSGFCCASSPLPPCSSQGRKVLRWKPRDAHPPATTCSLLQPSAINSPPSKIHPALSDSYCGKSAPCLSELRERFHPPERSLSFPRGLERPSPNQPHQFCCKKFPFSFSTSRLENDFLFSVSISPKFWQVKQHQSGYPVGQKAEPRTPHCKLWFHAGCFVYDLFAKKSQVAEQRIHQTTHRSWADEWARRLPTSSPGWSPASPATRRRERVPRPRVPTAPSARARVAGRGGWRTRRAGASRPTRANAAACRGSTRRSTASAGWFPSGARIKSCPSTRPYRWRWATSWLWLASWLRPSDSAPSGTGSVSTVSTSAETTIFLSRLRSCRERASPTARGSSASSPSLSRWPVRARGPAVNGTPRDRAREPSPK